MGDIKFNGWIDNPQWIQPGEPVTDEVTNRPIKEVFQDVNIVATYLQNHLNDYDNPHRVTLEQLGFDSEGVSSLQGLIQRIINDIAGSFVAEGLDVHIDSFDDANSKVNLVVTAGRAYREGKTVIFDKNTKLEVPTNKFYYPILGEMKTFQPGQMVYTLNEGPLRQTTQVILDVVRTENVTRGTVPGGTDRLEKSPVRRVLKVYQGDTVYQEGVDYQVVGDSIDWSLGGSEPDPGSTYTVEYVYGKPLVKGTEYSDGSLLRAGDTVTFFVASVDSNGAESDYSANAVKQVEVKKDGKYLKLYWNAVAGATAYRVYASVNGGEFKLVGETTDTSLEFWGVTSDTTPSGGGSVGPAEITAIFDYHPSAITLTGYLEDEAARYITPGDNYPYGVLLVSYEYHVPVYAIVQVTEKGIQLKWGEPDQDGDPKPPVVDDGAIGLAKLWVPALDVSKFFVWDIKARPPKAKLLQSIQQRLETVEDDIMRMKLALGLANQYTGSVTGSFVDDFTKADHIDWGFEGIAVDFTGSDITNPRVNTGTVVPDVPSENDLTTKALYWNRDTNEVLLKFTHEQVYKQDIYTRTIDLVSATFDTTPEPRVVIYPKIFSQGGRVWVSITGFEPNEEVDILVNGVRIGSLTTDVYGKARGWIRLPDDLVDQSAAVKVAQAANAQIQTLAKSLYAILKSAERSLWPVRRSYVDQVVSSWTRNWSWTSSTTRSSCCWWYRDTYTHYMTTITEVHKATQTTYVDRLGLQEQPLGTIDLGSTLRATVEVVDSSGKRALADGYLTTNPITIPVKAPVLTKHTDVYTSTWYYIRSRTYTRAVVHTRRYWWRDPLAESFTMPRNGFISRVGIRLAEISNDPNNSVTLRIGKLYNGLPGKPDVTVVVSQQEIANARQADGWVYIDLPTPIYYPKGTKLYVSFGADAPGYRAYVAKVGDNLPDGTPLTAKVNPAQVFFTSSNAETWTSDQSTNLCFAVELANFQGNPNVPEQLKGDAEQAEIIDFPEVEIPAGASVIAVHAEGTYLPPGTAIGWYVGIPTPTGDYKWIAVEEDRETPLGADVSRVKLRAVLKGTSETSPVIDLDGVKISHLAYDNNATYVSTMFELQNSTASNADIYVYAAVPEGQSMTVKLSTDDGQSWLDATLADQPEAYDLNRGIYLYKYTVQLPEGNEGKFRLKIDFTCDGLTPTVIDQVGVILR